MSYKRIRVNPAGGADVGADGLRALGVYTSSSYGGSRNEYSPAVDA